MIIALFALAGLVWGLLTIVALILFGSLCNAAARGDAIDRAARWALGPASSDPEATVLATRQDSGFEMGLLVAMDSWQDVPHERRHGESW